MPMERSRSLPNSTPPDRRRPRGCRWRRKRRSLHGRTGRRRDDYHPTDGTAAARLGSCMDDHLLAGATGLSQHVAQPSSRAVPPTSLEAVRRCGHDRRGLFGRRSALLARCSTNSHSSSGTMRSWGPPRPGIRPIEPIAHTRAGTRWSGRPDQAWQGCRLSLTSGRTDPRWPAHRRATRRHSRDRPESAPACTRAASPWHPSARRNRLREGRPVPSGGASECAPHGRRPGLGPSDCRPTGETSAVECPRWGFCR